MVDAFHDLVLDSSTERGMAEYIDQASSLWMESGGSGGFLGTSVFTAIHRTLKKLPAPYFAIVDTLMLSNSESQPLNWAKVREPLLQVYRRDRAENQVGELAFYSGADRRPGGRFGQGSGGRFGQGPGGRFGQQARGQQVISTGMRCRCRGKEGHYWRDCAERTKPPSQHLWCYGMNRPLDSIPTKAPAHFAGYQEDQDSYQARHHDP